MSSLIILSFVAVIAAVGFVYFMYFYKEPQKEN